MRVLSIQPFLQGYTISPFAGGKNKQCLHTARALVENGHEVFVLPWILDGERTLNQTKFRLSENGAYAIALPTGELPGYRELVRALPRFFIGGNLPRHPIKRMRLLFEELIFSREKALSSAIAIADPDLVHNHQTHSDFAKIYRKLGIQKPVILTNHSAGISSSVSDYDLVIFVSRFQLEQACRDYPSLNGKFRQIDSFASKEYHIPVTPKTSDGLVFIGLLNSDERKGLDILLNAYIADSALNRWRLIVVGDGPMRKEYQRLAEKHDLNVRFVGRLAGKDNAAVMSDSALFVMPSRAEGFALAYLEAICMGLPIIGYEPNVKELSEKLGMNVGYPFDASTGDHHQLANFIKQAMSGESGFDVPHRREMLRRAREYYSLERYSAEYMKLYREILASIRQS